MRLRNLALAATLLLGQVALVHATPNQVSSEKPTAANTASKRVTKPTWQELTHEQQQALQPLAQLWPQLREPHKRKWIALSRNFSQRTNEEKAVLQGRMKEWAALTPQQRTFARLNYANVQAMSMDERRAKWEAYQALPQEDKQKLAQKQTKAFVGAAPAIKPTPAQNRVAPPPASASANKPLPRISTVPVAPSTLLPAPTAVAPSSGMGTTATDAPSSAQ